MRPLVDRLSVMTVGAVLALGVGACGDSDDEDRPAQARTEATEPAVAPDGGKPLGDGDGKRPEPGDGQQRDGADGDGGSASGGAAADGSLDGGAGSGGSADGGVGSGGPAGDGGGVAPGSRGGGSETAEIAGVVTDLYRAFSRGDAAGVCATMSSAARRRTAAGGPTDSAGNRSCAAGIAPLTDAAAAVEDPGPPPKVTARDVAIDGDHATVAVSPDGGDGTVSMVRERGRWRLDGKIR